MKHMTRAEDEQLLAMIAARLSLKSTSVARKFGLTGPAVRIATNRVLTADLAESGECPVAVAAAYHWSLQ